MGYSGYTHFTKVDILDESPKAFKIRFYHHDRMGITCVWIPKSVISNPQDYKVGDTKAEVSIKDWFVDREKLEN